MRSVLTWHDVLSRSMSRNKRDTYLVSVMSALADCFKTLRDFFRSFLDLPSYFLIRLSSGACATWPKLAEDANESVAADASSRVCLVKCCCGRLCKGNRGLKMHQRSCRVILGLKMINFVLTSMMPYFLIIIIMIIIIIIIIIIIM